MLDVRIIEPSKEYEWISPRVVQDKNMGEVHICVDLIKLHDACSLHDDPFPTPFIDEMLESVGGQEVNYFTSMFSGYHHIRI